MADMTQAGAAPARIVASPAHWIGAGLSLALVAGVGFWGYQLTQRDVTVIPVVQALEGPFKVVPETAGGRQADHQGFAVNAVSGQGSATDAADEVALAPGGVGLTTEDQPLDQMKPIAREDVAPVEEVAFVSTTQEGLDRVNALAAAVAAESPITADQVAAAQEALRIRATQPEVTEPAVEVASVAAVVPAEVRPTFVGGVARSLRPIARPASLRVPAPASPAVQDDPVAQITQAVARAPAAPALEAIDVAPADLATGTQLVQVGALSSPQVARAEWDRLATRFGVLFSDKKRVIQRAENNGRTFYRLRVLGFDGLAEARRFCAVVEAGQTACIPVSHK